MTIDGVAFRPHDVTHHFHAGFLKDAKAFPSHDGIGVDGADHHPRDAVG